MTPETPEPVPALEIVDLHKCFGSLEVLKGISLTAHDGDVISVLGSSGSGKSTCLRCINLLEQPTSGTIRVKGETLKLARDRAGQLASTDPKQLARVRARLAMVFQSFNLWAHMTVLDNLIEAPVHVLKLGRAEAIERAERLLHKVGLYERRNYYPAHLSGGQQQRAAIARALAMEPDAILFDEPTSALDPIATGKIEQLIAELKQQYTILIVTHNMQQAARVSDFTAFMYLGELVEHGVTETIFTKPTKQQTEDYITGRFG